VAPNLVSPQPTAQEVSTFDLLALASDDVLSGKADVAAARENTRQRKIRKLALAVIVAGSVYIAHRLGVLNAPHVGSSVGRFLLVILLLGGLALVVLAPLLAGGRSPHSTYRASDIDVRLSDVRGAGTVTTEVVNTVNLFLGFKTFARDMGGTPRRGLLFEGPPGTGKTFMAKAMAGESGVPFLFVNASAFQSMYHGQTNRKIRAYFASLRKAARQEGGAIGFIEELDAIGASRAGMGARHGDGVTGVVNELLIQLQSFDTPTRSDRVTSAMVGAVNRWLPGSRQIAKRAPGKANILVIGATNRAADLDPALIRPGRFDRTITFDPPSRAGRADILGYYMAKKAHEPELGSPDSINRLAALTIGYTPVMLEHLLDEALVVALRRGARQMTWADVAGAKLVTELGVTQPSAYSEVERRTIATHEAGHATVAYFVGQSRKLEVLSIKKRKAALGLLQHSDARRIARTARHRDGGPVRRRTVLRRGEFGSGRRSGGRNRDGRCHDRCLRHGRIIGIDGARRVRNGRQRRVQGSRVGEGASRRGAPATPGQGTGDRSCSRARHGGGGAPRRAARP